MEHKDFFNFKSVAELIKNFSVDEDGESVKCGKIRQLVMDKSQPYSMNFKYGMQVETFKVLNMFRKNRIKKPSAIELELLYTKPLPLNRSKYI